MIPQTKSDKKNFWRRLESAGKGDSMPVADALAMLRFDANGLLPVIAQCADSGEVLMLAWTNRETLARTLAEGRMVYFSRSRRAPWRKGDSSGATQRVVSLAADCDGDALLATVRQTGGACHSGRRSCFYVAMDGDRAVIRTSGE